MFLFICFATWVCAAPCLAQVPTTTTVFSDRNPASPHTDVSIRIAVTAASGPTPQGTVSVYKDGNPNPIDTLTLDWRGIPVQITQTSAVDGSFIYYAVYTPSDSTLWQSSTSVEYTQVYGDPGTSVTMVSASANPTGYHQPVTLTARITGNLSVTGGEVTWTIDGSPPGPTSVSSNVSSTGQATLSIPAATLSLGSHTVKADFTHTNVPYTFFRPSSNVLRPDLLIVKEPTTTSAGSSLNPSTVGQAVTLTGTVVGAGSPAGDVTFQIDSSPVGVVTLSFGSATFDVSNLTVGHHNVVVSYPGDGTHAASFSTTMVQVVNKLTSAISLVSDRNPSTLGDDVTFTATVGGTSPTGTVTFSSGATVLGTSAVNSGQATITTSNLAVGEQTITALYSGDVNHTSVSTSLSPQTVQKRTPIVTVTSLVNPSAFGDSVTITANVTGAGPTPSGNVVFIIDGTPMIMPQNLSSGSASVVLDSLGGGTHTVSASYSGDGDYLGETATLLGGQVVQQATTLATITSSQNPATSGNPITYTATITSPTTTLTPPGQVTFSVGNVAQPPVSLVGGVATFKTSALPVGTTAVSVNYAGDSDFLASSAKLDQTINPFIPTPTPTPPPPQNVVSFTLRAITAPPAIQPGESGQFVIEISNTGNVGDTYQLSLTGDAALTLPLNALQATSGGTAQFLVTVTVPPDATPGQLASMLTVTSTAKPSELQSLALSAEVAASTSTKTFRVALQPGWNAVGFPVSQVLSVTPNAQIAGLSFYQNGAYDVAHLSLDALNLTSRGYWIFARSATTLEFTGVQPSSGQVALSSGWNLVNFPFHGPLPTSRLKFDSALVLADVNEVHSDNSYQVIKLGTDDVLTPGRPCWVFATALTEITY